MPVGASDPIVDRVRAKLLQRSTLGIVKYGTTLDMNPAHLREWVNHAQEEVMDLACYLERILMELEGK